VFVHSAKQVKVIWGTESMWDYTDTESGVQVYADVPVWRQIQGCDGEIARVRSKNFPGRVVVNLSQHTTSNRNLLARLIADAQTGVVIAPLLVVDSEAAISFASPLAYIEGLPQHQWTQSPSVATWTFVCPLLVPAALPGRNTLQLFA
jgi:hypothetical protein